MAALWWHGQDTGSGAEGHTFSLNHVVWRSGGEGLITAASGSNTVFKSREQTAGSSWAPRPQDVKEGGLTSQGPLSGSLGVFPH